MTSRGSPAFEGRITESQRKANNINQHTERDVNNSNRSRGRAGDSKHNAGPNSRFLDRSPSPYRRKRTRSPSPYRRKKELSRSPSPYRHRPDQQEQEGLLPQSKRQASPPREGPLVKRQHVTRSGPTDRQLDNRRGSYYAGSDPHTHERPNVQPVSYADREHAAPVPGFGITSNRSDRQKENDGNGRSAYLSRSREVMPDQPNGHNRGKRDQGDKVNSTEDVEMLSPENDTSAGGRPDPQDLLSTTESREEKKRKWAAIRAAAEKEKAKDDLLHQAVLANASDNAFAAASPSFSMGSPASPVRSPYVGHLDSVPPSPDVMIVGKEQTLSEGSSPAANDTAAADYDPLKDMLDDRERAAQKTQAPELPSNAYRETSSKDATVPPTVQVIMAKKQKKDFDMFDFDDDDEEAEKAVAEEETTVAAKGTVLDEKLLDNWDDSEGYYKIISNELVNGGRYRMIKALGRGVFANVAQAEDAQAEDAQATVGDGARSLVAVKMIRRNDLMRKASQLEMDFLRKVNEADPHDKRHIIRMLGSFDHKGHLCVVFEHMSKNLRDLLKEDTNGHGLSLQAVRSYSRQMFVGLQHLRNCQVVHCDLKPDNILVSADKKTIKLCDFGTAVDKRDVMDRTEYLVSRFYRAPEIILGMELGYGIDMWAIGCTAYELWTGKILFTGRSNNQMVKSFIDCLGWPTEKLLKKGLFENVIQHFEAGPPLKFVSREIDSHGKATMRLIEQQKKVSRDLKIRVTDAARGIAQDGPTTTELNDFADLLAACLNMNVEKRLQPMEALAHKFFPQQKLVPRPSVLKPPLMKRNLTGARR